MSEPTRAEEEMMADLSLDAQIAEHEDRKHRAIHLTRAEAWGLTLRVAASYLSDPEIWLMWEDVPYVDEASFELMEEQAGGVSYLLELLIKNVDYASGIDSADLYKKAQG